ncbi:MAG: PQQ-binding-like beta-propeller repeat protein [Dehalococcoidia bacterium]|nr:PQQ-binding-like beta-propeller repeat protein [Dehalococcoidia bacterium]
MRPDRRAPAQTGSRSVGAAKEDSIRRIARTHPLAVLALLTLAMLAAAGCVKQNNPQGWAGPVPSADGTVLVASTDKGKLSALKTEDFSISWTFPSGDEKPEIKLEAIYGTPLVDSDSVYFGAYSGDVYALGLDDGKVRWRFDADGPVIAGLGAIRGRVPPPGPGPVETVLVASERGTVYALDAADGSVQWRFNAGDDVWGAPLLEGDVLYVASVNGKLYALNAATGKPKWDKPFSTGHGLISDSVLSDGILLVGGIDRTLHAVDAETGEERWSFKTDNWFWGRPLVDGGTVYAPNLDGRVYALSLKDGSAVWEAPFDAKDPLRSAPVLAGDVLVIVDKGGNAYGLKPEDGKLKWAAAAALEKTVLADPAVLDGKVVVSAEGGDLFTVDPVAGSFVKVVTE